MLKKSAWIFIIISVIIISTFVSFKVKASFISQPTISELKESDAPVEYCWIPEEDYDINYPQITKIEDLENNSEFVLRVKPLDDGKNAAYSLIRKCSIVNSVKGDTNGEIIYIYEPSYPSGNRYWCHQGYTAMEKDKEYIVFLNKIENSEYAAGNKEIADGYKFTKPHLSKFEPGQKASLINFEEAQENTVFYKQIYSEPMLFDEESYINVYNNLLTEIEKKYNL